MKTRQLFLLLFAMFLSSAAFADEIGSGVIEPPTSTSMATAPSTDSDDEEGIDSETISDGDSLLQQLLDWIA